MGEVRHFRYGELSYKDATSGARQMELARLITDRESGTLGAGLARFDHCSVDWTVLYDEVMFVFEGTFRLAVGDRRYVCTPGDVLWIPERTTLKYESDGPSVCFYAVYPADWRKRHGVPEPA